MLLSVWHTSWTVADLNRSIAFYRDLLGFELVETKHRIGSFIEEVVGFEGAELKIATLRIPGAQVPQSGHHLELIEYVSPRGDRPQLRTCDVGVAHMALGTDSIHDTHARLCRAGVMFVSEPVRVPSGSNANAYACYLRDPDGFTIELVQPTGPE
jgi:catechol 2,3-dioxygenase-like lactoylglutathione lyase family enzyme